MNAPSEIDGADVLEWAWSTTPFGTVSGVEIYGLAICRYEGETGVYRFSCNAQWSTLQDEKYDSVTQAKHELPHQYRNVQAEWNAA